MQNPYNRYQQSGAKTGKVKSKPTPAKKSKAASRTRPRQPQSKAKQGTAPYGWILLSAAGLVTSFYIFNYTDDFLSLLNRIDFSVSGAVAADGAKAAESSVKNEAKTAPLPIGKSSGTLGGDDKLTMKKTNIYSALQEKRQALEKKERQLALLEEDLHKQKEEIEKQLKEMKAMRRNISSKLDKKLAADQESVDKLVGVYANMKPKNAASILANIDEDLAIRVLAKMKKQNAAAILDYVEPRKAQKLSEIYAGLKK